MILRRIGNKSKIAKEIQKYFPRHDVYIEPFFGAGGMFFNKPKVAHNFLNDIDSNVFNCFDVLINKKNELIKYIEMMPIHIDFWSYAKEAVPKDGVEKAVFFLLLSNFGYMGKPNTLHYTLNNSKDVLLSNIERAYKYLVSGNVSFFNADFREIFNKISFKNEREENRVFIYADPPPI